MKQIGRVVKKLEQFKVRRGNFSCCSAAQPAQGCSALSCTVSMTLHALSAQLAMKGLEVLFGRNLLY